MGTFKKCGCLQRGYELYGSAWECTLEYRRKCDRPSIPNFNHDVRWWTVSTILTVVSVAASVAATSYSAVSSHDAEVQANRQAREARAVSAIQAAEAKKIDATANDAALAEADRVRRKRAAATTIKTSAEGVLETPSVGKEQLGG
jgi:hypothetical protein